MNRKPHAYYNEIDPYCAQWLSNLIKEGHICDGVVDTRSIEDVKPKDLEGFTRCHFFAGIGGFELALNLANFPTQQPVWTGSCPCQPFSSGGSQKGERDARHLWPQFFKLIEQRKPEIVYGEQVANGLGKHWMSAVQTDLETINYAVGTFNFPAACVGAPHRRQRFYWVGDSDRNKWNNEIQPKPGTGQTFQARALWERQRSKSARRLAGGTVPAGQWFPEPESLTTPDGLPATMGQLRAYGNAIVPQVAAAFIKAHICTRVQEWGFLDS